MDFGRNNNSDSSAITITNPAIGHSAYIDEKAQAWGGVEADILYYLSDVNRLEELADKTANAEQLSLLLEPFLDNASKYFEAMQKLADGQVTWTELRKQFGGKVANAIAKIRKLNAEFGSEMELLDAKDRASILSIEAKRQNGLAEIGSELAGDLQAEMWRHQNKMDAIANREVVAEQRQSIQSALREKRQQLLNRATLGTNQGIRDQIPVSIAAGQSATNGVSASGQPRGFGGWFKDFFKN